MALFRVVAFSCTRLEDNMKHWIHRLRKHRPQRHELCVEERPEIFGYEVACICGWRRIEGLRAGAEVSGFEHAKRNGA